MLVFCATVETPEGVLLVHYISLCLLLQKGASDASNFDDDFTFQPAQLTPTDTQLVLSIDQTNFAGFSFTSDLYSKLH